MFFLATVKTRNLPTPGHGSGDRTTRTVLYSGVGWLYVTWRWRQWKSLALWMYAMWPLSHKMILFNNNNAAKETIVFHTSKPYSCISTSQTKEVAIVSQLYRLYSNCISYNSLLLILLSYLIIRVAKCILDNADKYQT